MATAGSRLHRFWYGAATAAAAIDATTIMLLENSIVTDWLSKGWQKGWKRWEWVQFIFQRTALKDGR